MSIADHSLRVIAVAAVVSFAGLVVLSKGWLEPDGFVIFDSHVRGYGPAEARAYLAAISPEQRALYQGVYRWLDTLFPILAAVALAGIIWRGASAMPVLVRMVAVLVPVAYLILDLTENAQVALILRGQATDATILGASAFTQGKWLVFAMAILLGVWAWRSRAKTQRGRAA